jgi:hypothetical protein
MTTDTMELDAPVTELAPEIVTEVAAEIAGPAKPARKPRAPKAAKPAKKAKARKAKATDGDDETSDADQSRSVVPRKYRDQYAKRAVKGTCSDEFAAKFSAACTEETEDGTAISPRKLRAFAKANGVWQPSYSGLNVGMQRMNIGNRLRAKIRKGHKMVWKVGKDAEAE